MPLWLFIRGLPFLMKNNSGALSVIGQWILGAPNQEKLRCSSELSLPVENAVQESVTAVIAVTSFSCWLDLKKGIYLLPTQNSPWNSTQGCRQVSAACGCGPEAGDCCWLLALQKTGFALWQSSWAQSLLPAMSVRGGVEQDNGSLSDFSIDCSLLTEMML